MKKWALYLALFLGVLTAPIFVAHANGPWFRAFQDYKFPSQAPLEHYSWGTPAAGSTTLLVSASPLPTASSSVISTFAAQPDVPRNITVSFGGSLGTVGAGSVVVSGSDIFGKSISESLSAASGQSAVLTGLRAFSSVSSVAIPATTGSSAQVSIGAGSSLGLPRCMDRQGDVSFSEFDGAYETTRGTVRADSTLVSKNLFQPNGTMNGAKRVDLLYIQNYRCYGN